MSFTSKIALFIDEGPVNTQVHVKEHRRDGMYHFHIALGDS